MFTSLAHDVLIHFSIDAFRPVIYESNFGIIHVYLFAPLFFIYHYQVCVRFRFLVHTECQCGSVPKGFEIIYLQDKDLR